jgi:hypothetical protein
MLVRLNAEVYDNGCRVERTTIIVHGAQIFLARFFKGGDIPLWMRRFTSVPARRAAIREALTSADAVAAEPDAPPTRKVLPFPDRRPHLPRALYDDLVSVWAGGHYGSDNGSPLGQTDDLTSFGERCGRLIHDPSGTDDVAIHIAPCGFVLIVVCFWDRGAGEQPPDRMAWSFEILLSDCADELIAYVAAKHQSGIARAARVSVAAARYRR